MSVRSFLTSSTIDTIEWFTRVLLHLSTYLRSGPGLETLTGKTENSSDNMSGTGPTVLRTPISGGEGDLKGSVSEQLKTRPVLGEDTYCKHTPTDCYLHLARQHIYSLIRRRPCPPGLDRHLRLNDDFRGRGRTDS